MCIPILLLQKHDGVTRLADAYLSLCNVGCKFFEKWRIVFNTDTDAAYNTEISLSDPSKININESKGSATSNLLQLCKCFEQCLNEWNDLIQSTRDHYKHLDEFTTRQIIILCNDMAPAFHEKQKISTQAIHLIQRIKRGCTQRVNISLFITGARENLKSTAKCRRITNKIE